VVDASLTTLDRNGKNIMNIIIKIIQFCRAVETINDIFKGEFNRIIYRQYSNTVIKSSYDTLVRFTPENQ
jgi:hypothetical protein